MATDEQTVDPDAEGDAVTEPEAKAEPEADVTGPSWWHRDHPTFSALTGFFTGLVSICVVPALFIGIMTALVGSDRAESLFPFVLVLLAIPLVLVVFEHTRRFGTYLWIGILSTAVVVIGVGALVFWYMVKYQS